MSDSILISIKKLLGIPSEDTSFDEDILVHINSAFMTLHQVGVGPATVFSITDNTTEWSSFSAELSTYSSVKSYVYLFVKYIFDPQGTSFHLNASKALLDEFLWRLTVQVPIPPDPIIP